MGSPSVASSVTTISELYQDVSLLIGYIIMDVGICMLDLEVVSLSQVSAGVTKIEVEICVPWSGDLSPLGRANMVTASRINRKRENVGLFYAHLARVDLKSSFY